MADNSPNAVQIGSYPNVTVPFHKRVTCHIATIAVATGTPAVVQTSSTAGIAVVDTATGRITVTFPPGGTGAIGWVMCSLVSQSTPSGQVSIDLDSDLTNFATGTLEVSTWDQDNTSGIATAADLTGSFTLAIYVVAA